MLGTQKGTLILRTTHLAQHSSKPRTVSMAWGIGFRAEGCVSKRAAQHFPAFKALPGPTLRPRVKIEMITVTRQCQK